MAERLTETYNATDTRSAANPFSEAALRNAFVRKVYGILSAQLAMSTGLGGLVMYNLRTWEAKAPNLVFGLVVVSCFASLALMCVLMCSPQLLRKTPHNYFLLAAFTVFESLMVGAISTQFTTESVLVVFALTAAVVVGLTLLACTTSVDFTGMGPYIFAFAMVLCAFGMCLWFASMAGVGGSGAFGVMRLLYAAGAALLASVYIVFDTQMIVGGKHRYRFSIDDYAMAAIVLYMDIIQLFVNLLYIFGDRR